MIATWQVWLTIALLAGATFVIKGAGPFLLGRREIPTRLLPLVVLLPSALLTGLVVAALFQQAPDGALTFDVPLVVGVAGAALALALRLPLVLVLATAVLVTALLRAMT